MQEQITFDLWSLNLNLILDASNRLDFEVTPWNPGITVSVRDNNTLKAP